MIAPCDNPNHRVGLFNISTGEFFPDCGCLDEVVLPIDAILASIPKSRVISMAEKIFPTEMTSAKKAFLAKKVADWSQELAKYTGALPELRSGLSGATAKLNGVIDEIQSVLQSEIDFNNAKESLVELAHNVKEALEFVLSRKETLPDNLDDLAFADPWWEIIQYLPTRVGFPGPDKLVFDGNKLVGGTLFEELREIAKKSDNLKSRLPELEAAKKKFAYEEAMWKVKINYAEENIERINLRIQDANDGILNIDDYQDLAAELIPFAMTILALLSVVQSHQCQDPSMLDESTCKCDKCPAGKELCKNYQQEFYLPRFPRPLPGSSVADERNYCVDPCCDGQQNLWFETTFAGGGCKCVCPNIGGEWWPVGRFPDMLTAGWNPKGEEQELKPCQNGAENLCSGGMACGKKNPPDYGKNPISKYEWDATSCEWKCKEGLCEGNKKVDLNPVGLCRCVCEQDCPNGMFQDDMCACCNSEDFDFQKKLCNQKSSSPSSQASSSASSGGPDAECCLFAASWDCSLGDQCTNQGGVFYSNPPDGCGCTIYSFAAAGECSFPYTKQAGYNCGGKCSPTPCLLTT